jgi:hypothetical protein
VDFLLARYPLTSSSSRSLIVKQLLRLVLVGAVIAVLTTISHAQPDSLWCHTYGGTGEEYLVSAVQTADGGYILGGTTSSFGAGANDLWLIKTNAAGDTLWCRTYGGSLNDFCGNAGVTMDGGYFMTGYTSSYGVGNRDYWLIRTNADGDTLWTHTYGGAGIDNLYWGQQTADSGFILAGESTSFGGNYDFWILKVDANGDSVWSRTFGFLADAGATYVIQTADSGFIVTGVTRPSGGGLGDYQLLKLNTDGTVAWDHTYLKTWDDIPWCVQQTLDGGYVLAGNSERSNGFLDAWLLKTAANGDSLWSLTYGSANLNEKAISVKQTSDSGFVVAGESGLNNGDILLIKTDSRGNMLWDRTFGGTAEDVGYDIQVTADGGYAIAGGTYSYGTGGADAWLVKTGPDSAAAVDPVVLQPSSYSLSNYPNPFNPSTTIAYQIAKSGFISLRVFDLLGREVAVLKEGIVEAGAHQVLFDGSALASGVYFTRLEAGIYSRTQKLVLMK